MSFVINRGLLEQTSFTSTSPAGLACVVHPIAAEGEHELHVLDDADQTSETIPVMVTARLPDGSEPAASLAVDPGELRAAQLRRGPTVAVAHHIVRAGAHLMLNAPSARDARRVRLVRKSDGGVAFDSASLGAGDRFAVTLIRPGRYQLDNQLSGHRLTLTVAYPVRGKQPYRPPAPLEIECTQAGFQAPVTTVKPAQGVVIVCRVPSRIQVALVQPDDGPHGGASQPAGVAPTGPEQGAPRERLTDEARAVLRRVLHRFTGKRDGG